MATQPRDRTTTWQAVPRQRHGEELVVAAIGPDEPHGRVVQVAARAAHERGIPLHIALVAWTETSISHCMAVMDDAVAVARRCSPDVHVQISGPFGPDYTSSVDSIRANTIQRMVCSQRTHEVLETMPELAWLADQPLTVL